MCFLFSKIMKMIETGVIQFRNTFYFRLRSGCALNFVSQFTNDENYEWGLNFSWIEKSFIVAANKYRHDAPESKYYKTFWFQRCWFLFVEFSCLSSTNSYVLIKKINEILIFMFRIILDKHQSRTIPALKILRWELRWWLATKK